MALLSCWCPYPNRNTKKDAKKSVSYQAKSLGLWRAAEGDVALLLTRLRSIKDLCFAFLYHWLLEVSKHIGNLLLQSMWNKRQHLLETKAEKELGT